MFHGNRQVPLSLQFGKKKGIFFARRSFRSGEVAFARLNSSDGQKNFFFPLAFNDKLDTIFEL
jgi:hypothetical protein